ncbi:FAD-dependent oxidoreductase [Sediminitomix flava]|uniref:FAD dependent oxidoreductase n=1 Tax=Sediminitomix flava TaxID=379075 RepID=A0A315ZGE3_SEDFL|nr:FAD-dependent oxidoreductase [Sediminitomix flava]PWJ43814.1 FAD dependent oxidoreductase [Sediminitomix flava]
MTEIEKKSYDVVVAGAGIAGIGAAVKAGRMGVKTLLIERYGFVGGMSTAGMVSPFMKHDIDGDQLVKGVFQDIEDRMISQGGMIDNGFYAANFRIATLELLEEANVDILLHAEPLTVEVENKRLQSIDVLVDGLVQRIEANTFIDTTGDAQLLYLGNLPWVKGDEKTGKTQAMTLFFRMAGIDMKKAFEWAKQNPQDFLAWNDFVYEEGKIASIAGWTAHVKKGIQQGKLPKGLEYVFFTTLPEDGEGSFNCSNILGLDASNADDLTKAEVIGREQVDAICRMLQDEVEGFENAYLLETAVQVGVRETRRALGDYEVTGDDIAGGTKFEDKIARGCYGIDIHGQEDEESRMEDLPEGHYYDVPFRSLLVSEVENVMVAGRCISSTREGHSALRIMPTACATGEACGTAAALSAIETKNLRDISITKIQEEVSYNI